MDLSPTGRARRATVLIGLAVVAVLVAGAAYVRPSFRPPPVAATPPPPPPAAIGSIFFADADHGAVSVFQPEVPGPGAFGPTLFLTRDGGRTWTRDPGSAILSVPGSRFLVIGSLVTGAVLRVSEDGGRTWRTMPVPAAAPQAVAGAVYGPGGAGWPVLLDAAHAWWMTRPAPGDPFVVELWRTSNGGRTWTRLPATGVPNAGIKEQPWFADERRGLLVVTDPGTGASVLATDDGGATWREAAHFSPLFPSAWTVGAALVARGDRLVLCLETTPNAPSSQPIAPINPLALNVDVYTAASADGGATWGPLTAGPGLSSASLPQFDDRGRLLLLSDRRLWVSADDGARWQSRTVALPAGTRVRSLESAARGALFAMAVRPPPASGHAPLTGPGAPVLLRSRDGGAHWEELELPRVPVR